MFITDYIRVYEGSMPMPPDTDMGAEIIRRFEATPSVRHELEQPDASKPPIRSYQELLLDDALHGYTDVNVVLKKLTEMAIQKYHSDVPLRTFPKDIGCETFRINKMRPGTEDRFGFHVDVNNHEAARRFMGLVWFLEDVDKGGEMFFPVPNVRIRPKKGRLVMFPSLWMYPYSIEPLTGEQPSYYVTTYLHYL